MRGGIYASLCVIGGIAGGFIGDTILQGLGYGLAINAIVICADQICNALKERR